jgi:hypothetical protein
MDSEKSPDSHDDQKEEYPPKKLVIPAMIALYLAVFLIAIVNILLPLPPTYPLSLTRLYRTERFSALLFLGSQMDLTALEISRGMSQAFYFLFACFNCLLASYMYVLVSLRDFQMLISRTDLLLCKME